MVLILSGGIMLKNLCNFIFGRLMKQPKEMTDTLLAIQQENVKLAAEIQKSTKMLQSFLEVQSSILGTVIMQGQTITSMHVKFASVSAFLHDFMNEFNLDGEALTTLQNLMQRYGLAHGDTFTAM